MKTTKLVLLVSCMMFLCLTAYAQEEQEELVEYKLP
ncbi:hypothetical protein ING2E5A_0861 [Petrimonas mucosa]|uniref:Secreted protein n=1 Tax=Petrimonas mucosa TaxID=1642646 RepID=A0A1G4G5D2_9BACT|nr:hypothetical protein ING2E5A_0861 [Petrimonas mucosa]